MDNSLRAGNLEQVTGELSDLAQSLEQAQSALTTAEKRYARDTDRYYYSTDEAHQASFAEHLPALAKTEAQVEQAASLAAHRARQIMQLAANEYPLLTDDEQGVASAKAPFVKEDCESLPYAELLNRVRHAALMGDRPSMWLYARYGKQRLAQGRYGSAAGDNSLDDDAADGPEAHADERAELVRTFADIEDSLRPGKLKELRKSALDTLTQANTLQSAAGKRRWSQAVYSWQKPGDVPW